MGDSTQIYTVSFPQTVFHCRVTLYHFNRGFNVCKHLNTMCPDAKPHFTRVSVLKFEKCWSKVLKLIFFAFFSKHACKAKIFLFRLKVMLKTFFLCKVGVKLNSFEQKYLNYFTRKKIKRLANFSWLWLQNVSFPQQFF